MSNTSITNLQITDTFQIWINKTNEVIDLANENVMLAGPGIGFTVQGNSTLEGTFTADELVSDTATLGAIFTNTLTRSVDAAEPILSASPIRINTSVENILNLESTSGNKPNLRMINGGNARWNLGHVTATASSAFNIKTETASTPQLSISQAGRVTAVEFQGDGNRLTNINPNNIAAGTFAVANIPNLDANKITTGTLGVDRIPNLNTSKITAGEFNVARIPNLDAGKIATGTFADARIPNLNASKITAGTFADARIPNLNASKITAGVLPIARGGTGGSTAETARVSLGGTTTGIAVFTATNQLSARSAIGAQQNLGFVPVQQGGGAGQGNNKIFIGWDGTAAKIQVDGSDKGRIFAGIAPGTAPFFACRAFGFVSNGNKISGGNFASYNTTTGVVTFNVSMPDNNYSVVVTGSSRGGNEIDERTSNSFRISSYSSGGNLINRAGLTLTFAVFA